MILDHKRISFDTIPLIEKITVKSPFRLSLNFTDDACFIFFNSGKATINAPYEQKTVNSKEAVLLKCGTYFSELLPTLEQEVNEIIVFHLPKKIIREVYSSQFPVSLHATSKTFIQKIDTSQMLADFTVGLQVYFNNPNLINNDLLKLKIQELILLLLQTNSVDTLKELFSNTFSHVEISLKDVVFSHIFTNCSLNDLAELCNMSLSTFKRQFEKVFHETPSNFLKSKRLERGKELLHNKNVSISEIAFDTCFYDTAHFSRSFKDKYGQTPAAYRKSIT